MKKLERKVRVRARIKYTSDRPRLTVFRSNRHIFAQIIDDAKGVTLLGVSDKSLFKGKKDSPKAKTEAAGLVGEELAKLAKGKKISNVTFDRGGYKYHGRVKALAEGARKGGLVF